MFPNRRAIGRDVGKPLPRYECRPPIPLFPYSPWVSGGHANAIRAFLQAQRGQGIEAVGIAPRLPEGYPSDKQPLDFPFAEVDSEANLTWAWMAKRFGFTPEESVVHIHTISGKLKPLLKSLRQQGVPYVLTSHGQLHFRNVVHWAKKFVYLNVFNRDIRKAAAIHCLTADAKRRVRWLLPGYKGKCFVQPHAVDLPDLTALPPLPRSDYGIPQDAFLWLFLGRLDVHVKGLDLLVEAFSRLDPNRFWLAFAGPDWAGGKERLEALAERLQCRDRIRFLGPLYGEKKWGAFKMANSFAAPSRWDAFNLSVAEAMACALPVVASQKMSLATDFKAADAAQVFPLDVSSLAKTMALFGSDETLRNRFAKQGKHWIETHCTPLCVGRQFQAIYQSLLQK